MGNRIKTSLATLACALASMPGTAHAVAVVLQNGTGTFSQDGGGCPAPFVCTPASSIDGNTTTTGWAIADFPAISTSAQTAVFETTSDLFSSGGMLTFVLDQNFTPNSSPHSIGRFRLSATTDDRSLFADGLGTGGDVTANWTVLDLTTFAATGGAILTELGDLSLLASGPNPQFTTYTVTTSTLLSGITGFRLEVLDDPSLPTGGPGRMPTNGNFVLANFTIDAVANTNSGVPEPGTWAMMLLGFGLMGASMRRKQRAARVRFAI